MNQDDAYPGEEEYPQENEYPEEPEYPTEDQGEEQAADEEGADGEAADNADGEYEEEQFEQEMDEQEQPEDPADTRDIVEYNAEEEGAVDVAEPYQEQEEEGEYAGGKEDAAGDITNPYYFRQEIQRIEQCETVLSRGLASMPKQELDDETRVNLLDICADLEAEEDALFSPMPDCVANVLQKQQALTEKKNRNVQPHEDCRRSTSGAPSRFSEEQRAFVDPSVPLEVPYSEYRFKKEHPAGREGRGVYHDLFYGDGTQCQFVAPEDNKRRQLEEEKAAHAIKRRPKPSYEPTPLRTLKVSKDFVPACANVDNSEVQRKLRESQGPQMQKRKPKAARS